MKVILDKSKVVFVTQEEIQKRWAECKHDFRKYTKSLMVPDGKGGWKVVKQIAVMRSCKKCCYETVLKPL